MSLGLLAGALDVLVMQAVSSNRTAVLARLFPVPRGGLFEANLFSVFNLLLHQTLTCGGLQRQMRDRRFLSVF